MKSNGFSLISYIIICFTIATLCCSVNASSQQMPSFKMTLSNGKTFYSVSLPKGKPLVLIYFDPDCDHCQKLMTELFKNINSFKKTEIVLITFKSVPELLSFEKKYNTRKYANIKVGTEGTEFYLKNFYKLIKMPFTVLYDKKGNYNYSYRDEFPFAELLNRLKTL